MSPANPPNLAAICWPAHSNIQPALLFPPQQSPSPLPLFPTTAVCPQPQPTAGHTYQPSLAATSSSQSLATISLSSSTPYHSHLPARPSSVQPRSHVSASHLLPPLPCHCPVAPLPSPTASRFLLGRALLYHHHPFFLSSPLLVACCLLPFLPCHQLLPPRSCPPLSLSPLLPLLPTACRLLPPPLSPLPQAASFSVVPSSVTITPSSSPCHRLSSAASSPFSPTTTNQPYPYYRCPRPPPMPSSSSATSFPFILFSTHLWPIAPSCAASAILPHLPCRNPRCYYCSLRPSTTPHCPASFFLPTLLLHSACSPRRNPHRYHPPLHQPQLHLASSLAVAIVAPICHLQPHPGVPSFAAALPLLPSSSSASHVIMVADAASCSPAVTDRHRPFLSLSRCFPLRFHSRFCHYDHLPF
ncbi:hypothetical protein BHE74_00007201 [Ensete ventricosum]|nr:hypothetical protein BHE74_00007201 [Ensete ventricosum]